MTTNLEFKRGTRVFSELARPPVYGTVQSVGGSTARVMWDNLRGTCTTIPLRLLRSFHCTRCDWTTASLNDYLGHKCQATTP